DGPLKGMLSNDAPLTSEALLPLAVPAALTLTSAVESSSRSSQRPGPSVGRQTRDGRRPRRGTVPMGKSLGLRRPNFMFDSGEESEVPPPSWRRDRRTLVRLNQGFSGIPAEVPSMVPIPVTCPHYRKKGSAELIFCVIFLLF